MNPGVLFSFVSSYANIGGIHLSWGTLCGTGGYFRSVVYQFPAVITMQSNQYDVKLLSEPVS